MAPFHTHYIFGDGDIADNIDDEMRREIKGHSDLEAFLCHGLLHFPVAWLYVDGRLWKDAEIRISLASLLKKNSAQVSPIKYGHVLLIHCIFECLPQRIDSRICELWKRCELLYVFICLLVRVELVSMVLILKMRVLP